MVLQNSSLQASNTLFNMRLCHEPVLESESIDPIETVSHEMQRRAEHFGYGLGYALRGLVNRIQVAYVAARDNNNAYHSAVLADDMEGLLEAESGINQRNLKGETPLKMAIAFKRENMVRQLLAKGAAVDAETFSYAVESQVSMHLLKQLFGQSPLYREDLPSDHLIVLARNKGHKEAKKLLLKKAVASITNCYKKNGQSIRKFSEFTFQEKIPESKYSGRQTLGKFHDLDGEAWWLKRASWKEHLAGPVLSLFLGDAVPTTEVILDDIHGEVLTASKNIPNFTDLARLHSRQPSVFSTFPVSYNGKPIQGFLDTACAITFLGDLDAHLGNVGLIEHETYYTIGKVDNDFTFAFRVENGESTEANLDNLRRIMRSMNNHRAIPLKECTFHEVYEAIMKISRFHFSHIEQVYQEAARKLKILCELIQLSHLNLFFYRGQERDILQEFLKIQEESLHYLRARQQQFAAMANYMLLEKAIIDHDQKTLGMLAEKGISADAPFKPYFEGYEQTYDVTGRALAKKHWPEALEHPLFTKEAGSKSGNLSA